jgi:hypothetical protein
MRHPVLLQGNALERNARLMNSRPPKTVPMRVDHVASNNNTFIPAKYNKNQHKRKIILSETLDQ